VIATAEGDASRFRQINAEYAKAPEVTRSRMYLDTMQQVYANTSKVLVDSKGAGQSALSAARQADAGRRRRRRRQRRRQSGDGACGATRSSPPISNEVPPQMTEGRSRENLRQRDREAR
jgi:membrane protease subunit HflK